MFEKVKGFVQKHKTKAAVAVGSAAASMVMLAPVAFAEDNLEAGIITSPIQTADMWTTLTSGGTTFINGFLVPVSTFCSSSPIVLLLLTATLIKLAVGVLKRAIGAFGRGR